MTESVLEFGPGRRFVGILSKPGGTVNPRDIAVLITNSGIIHRVGANRMHVRLARAFAQQGYPTLRYDLPGIGDSERVGSGASVMEENIAGTRAALDALQKAGIASRFIIIGLCSGADHSFTMACADPRIAGAVLIDPTIMFSTRRHRLNRILKTARRGARPHVWWRLLTGRYRVTEKLRSPHEPALPGTPRSMDPVADAEAYQQTVSAFSMLAQRGARLLVVITRHNSEIYSYRRQIFDTMPQLPDLEKIIRVEQIPRAEHTFSAEADRRTLESGILTWLTTALDARTVPT